MPVKSEDDKLKSKVPTRKTSSKGGKIGNRKSTGSKPKKPIPLKSSPLREPLKEESRTPSTQINMEEEETEGSEPHDPNSKIISMKPPIVVKELANKLGIKTFQLVHHLMEMNIFADLNQSVEESVAREICEKNGFEFVLEKREKGAGVHKVEKKIEPPPPKKVVTNSQLITRPPVITFMGHVDHGKTSLLDALRKSRVASGEAGGITQHIGASSLKHKDQTITFLDTPGHEAFTAIRARGANVTDIAVIVIAADDGIMPQTREAIKHAQAAHVSIMVAINKVDLPSANIDKVKAQLQEIGLTPEDWGGETICVEVSATKGMGLDTLLEMMLLQAEVLELKSIKTGFARGVVIESQVEVGRGPNATVLVQEGTLKVGDAFICGKFWGKVKALIDHEGKPTKEAAPSTAVKILGFNGAPMPGEEFAVMKDDREARKLAETRSEDERLGKLDKGPQVTLENLFANTREGQKKILNLVIKSDVQGSLEAIEESLNKIPSDQVEINYLMTGVGPITVNDILLAKASQAVVIGFNTKTENSAATAAKREDVQIKLYSIIYELIDQVRDAMAGLLDPEVRENQIGIARVKKVFELSKFPVAGCIVESGRIAKTARARVIRRKQPIYDGGIHTLKRFQDEAAEVRAGMECGIRLGNFSDYLEDDTIECYTLENVPRSL